MRLQRLVMLTMLCGLPALAEAQAPAQPPQPVPLGVNGALTPWLQMRGEFRARIEGFSGGGFGDTSDAYWMDRFRLNATVRAAKSLAFVVQAQDARAFDKTSGVAGGAVPRHARSADGVRRHRRRRSTRPGRAPGARVRRAAALGHLNWANTARSFDGARATMTRRSSDRSTRSPRRS